MDIYEPMRAMNQDEERLFGGKKLEDMTHEELVKYNSLVKKEYDKRQTIKENDIRREMERG